MERTLVFLKADALRRGLVGEIIGRFERKGFLIEGLKMVALSEEFVREHYAAHRGKEFYEPLVRYVTSGPAVAMVLAGRNAVAVVRRMMGETFGSDAEPGTIRGDLALSNRYNLVHGSDSPEAAGREIGAFFEPDELVSYGEDATRWIYDQTGPEPV
ncbi:MAG: nucleoside diphosphate kinase [Planctomycetes bacterium SM23_32]|nr:MAG: nucleoside diphosphate kinase [Planctomycetes bacterium SM23_32]